MEPAFFRGAKRLILVADDEEINREILGEVLSHEYDVIFAEDGEQTLSLMREHAGRLSLVLLDMIMPGTDGFGVLEVKNSDPAISRIPVIVLTTEKEYELRSLRIGAWDFIKKPYDYPEVVLARVARIIDLYESSSMIKNTERDELTGLYNQSYFFRYAQRMDLYDPDAPMDALAVDIAQFHALNELNGHQSGDGILKALASNIKSYCVETSSISCRKEADMFLVYSRHCEDPEKLLARFAEGVGEPGQGVRLRLGVYPLADKQLDIRLRFDRAKLAVDSIRRFADRSVCVYDEGMHKKELLDRRLLNDMDEGLNNGHFCVWYQPKFNVTGDRPVLASAEALVRWKHPELGTVSPGIFIPLFEENGLITRLDRFVWKTAAAQIKRWKEKNGVSLPVSINVSRVDLFDPDLIPALDGIVEAGGIGKRELMLEITESAYTRESDRVTNTVSDLRSAGYMIEMDDFGSGYSSLNMLDRLPMDAMKLDMGFIRELGKSDKSTLIVKLMIDIAKALGVPVIAEGVENSAQLSVLRSMGCDIIQGYYFSPPVCPEDFEAFFGKEYGYDDK